MTSRLSPCPPSFGKTYTLETAQAPFQEGVNSISVCAYDYAQTGTPNGACESKEILVNNLCPGSPVGGGNTITAGFAGNHKAERTLAFRNRALIRGRLHDPSGNPVANAQVCLQGHTDLPGRPYHLIGTATTNENGGWTYKLARGPSRVLPHRLPFRRLPDLDRTDPAHAGASNAPPESPPRSRPPTDLLLRRDRRTQLRPTRRHRARLGARLEAPLPRSPREDRRALSLPRRLCLLPSSHDYEIRFRGRRSRTEWVSLCARPLRTSLHPGQAVITPCSGFNGSSTKEDMP